MPAAIESRPITMLARVENRGAMTAVNSRAPTRYPVDVRALRFPKVCSLRPIVVVTCRYSGVSMPGL